MPELIERQAALEIAMCYCPDDDGCCSKAGHDIREMLDEIEALPTIEPGVRHGRWIDAHMISGGDFYRCSECGCYIEQIYFANDYNVRYCPNCGTKMDGGAEQ